MTAYYVLQPISHDGKHYRPGDTVDMETESARQALRRGLITDQFPEPEPERPMKYRVLSPVSHNGKRILPGAVIVLDVRRAAPLIQVGALKEME